MVENPPVEDSWFVALVRSGREAFAREHLLNSGFDEAFYPRRRLTRVARGKTFELILPVFHGYVLVRTFAFTPFLWHLSVRDDRHRAFGLVRGFIGGWPANPVPIDAVRDTKSMCDGDGIALPILEAGPVLYEPGTVVRVAGDVYDGQTFVVVWDNGVKGLNLRALQGAQFAVYIEDRDRVFALLAEPGSVKSNNNPARPSRKRLFRDVRSSAQA